MSNEHDIRLAYPKTVLAGYDMGNRKSRTGSFVEIIAFLYMEMEYRLP
jgi:hypothetical protein